VVLVQLAPLDQQLQRRQPPLARHHLEVFAIRRRNHGKVLQKADTGDACVMPSLALRK
jgi:hypothetical protein